MAADPLNPLPHLQETILYLKAAVAGLSAALAIVWRWAMLERKTTRETQEKLRESLEARIAAEERHAREASVATERTIMLAQTIRADSDALRRKPKNSDGS